MNATHLEPRRAETGRRSRAQARKPVRRASPAPAVTAEDASWIAAPLLATARAAIAAELDGMPFAPPPAPPGAAIAAAGGVFVTLWAPDGDLRGCIGFVGPHGDLAEAVADAAIGAATRDVRFPAVGRGELAELIIEISFLGPAERVHTLGELDPTVYGIFIDQDGRRGVLLPALEGVATPGDQLRIAARKGHVSLARPFDVYRFKTRKLRDAPARFREGGVR